MVRDRTLGEEPERAVEILPRHLEGVMALAEGLAHLVEAARRALRLPEQGAVAVAVAQEPLVGEPHLDGHAEHVGVKALRAIQIAHVDAEVIEPPHVDHGMVVRQWALMSARGAIQTRGVWRT